MSPRLALSIQAALYKKVFIINKKINWFVKEKVSLACAPLESPQIKFKPFIQTTSIKNEEKSYFMLNKNKSFVKA